MLIDKNLADTFLGKYKEVMKYLNNDIEPSGFEKYGSIRPLKYERINEIDRDCSKVVGARFID